MKKKLAIIFSVCLVCIMVAIPAFAAGNDDLIVDDAHLLTTDEKEQILEELLAASNDLGMDVVVHTTDGTGGKSITPYADDFLDNNGYGQGSSNSAVGLVLDMDSREYAFSTMGDARWYFTDYGVDEVLNEVKSYLSDGEYAAAFDQYVSVVKSLVAYRDSHGYAYGENTAANTDTNYDNEKSSSSVIPIALKVILAILIGFALSFVATKKMKDKMNNVRMKASASDYYNRDELRITGSRDTFLYHTVTKTPRNNDSNNSSGGGGGFSFHTSSGGVSHGGGSSRF